MFFFENTAKIQNIFSFSLRISSIFGKYGCFTWLYIIFFAASEIKVEEINALCKELVEKSLKDHGNIAYDYFTSGTRNGVMMICETWENEEVLKAHMASEHFTTLVPKIEALTKNGLKLEQFSF